MMKLSNYTSELSPWQPKILKKVSCCQWLCVKLTTIWKNLLCLFGVHTCL